MSIRFSACEPAFSSGWLFPSYVALAAVFLRKIKEIQIPLIDKYGTTLWSGSHCIPILRELSA